MTLGSEAVTSTNTYTWTDAAPAGVRAVPLAGEPRIRRGMRVRVADLAYSSEGRGFVDPRFFGMECLVLRRSPTGRCSVSWSGGTNTIHENYLTEIEVNP